MKVAAKSARRWRGRAVALAALGLVGSSALAACGSDAEGGTSGGSGSPTVTVLESTPGFFDLPIHVAADEFAKENGLTIKLVQVQGGGAAGQEFQGGTGDIAVTAADIPLRLQMQKAVSGGVTVIGSNQFTMLYTLTTKADSPITSLTQLKGKKIGITGPKSSSELVTRWAMKTKFNMDPSKDATFVALGSVPTILEAVKKGSVDAGILFSPALEQGLADKSVKIIYDFRTFKNGQNVFYARTQELSKNPAKYQKYMKAYTAAVSKMEADPDFAFAQAKKYYGKNLTDETLRGILDFYMKNEWTQTSFTQESYDATRDVLLNSDSGFTEQNIPSYADITKGAPTP